MILWFLITLFNLDTRYTQNAIVIALEDDIAVFESEDGNIWANDNNNYNIGDTVIMIMDNNDTEDDITDDIIIKVKRD